MSKLTSVACSEESEHFIQIFFFAFISAWTRKAMFSEFSRILGWNLNISYQNFISDCRCSACLCHVYISHTWCCLYSHWNNNFLPILKMHCFFSSDIRFFSDFCQPWI
jgi:hypothetical protein